VKKRDDMDTIELEILKYIKVNPSRPNRFANLYDYWEQPEEPRPLNNENELQEHNQRGFLCFAMEMFGCSVWDLINDAERFPARQFSLKCILQMGIDLTKCIRDLHRMGFIHLDVKPDNVVVSKDKGDRLYLIDYGISEQYIFNGRHRPQVDVKQFCGNLVYISKNAFEYKTQARRDDLISMMYMLIYMLTSHLPWHNRNFNIRNHKPEIARLKLKTIAKEVCTGEAKLLAEILEEFYQMKYKDEPDYQYIIYLFEKILLNIDLAPSPLNFDWILNIPN
jgi:serine/threonine protein kinase